MNIPYFSCIFARDFITGGIGLNNEIPWKIKEDMKEFKRITMNNSEGRENIVIMGRRTFQSINSNPLPNRINIIVSSSLISTDKYYVVKTLDLALLLSKTFGKSRYIFVIGGVNLFKESFNHPQLETIYMTEISIPFLDEEKIEYDVFFNNFIPNTFTNVYTKKILNDTVSFSMWNKSINTGEKNYKKLLNDIIKDGETRDDRTGTGTISLFGPQLTFDLTKGFPLLTTKTVPLRIVFEELMFFIRGQTNNKILQNKKVNIWNGNSSKEYMKSINLEHYPEGELGPIYGAQWRNFGGYHDLQEEKHIAKGEGIDQLSDVIKQLKNNPTSRRIIVSAWNPKVLKEIALPACHLLYQFYVRKDTYLDCKVILRSSDTFLGLPFNIASYALLVYMMSSVCDYTPGKLIISLGDSHIYKNHINQVNELLLRPVRRFPELNLLKNHENIEDFEFEDFELLWYNPHPTIKAEMAV